MAAGGALIGFLFGFFAQRSRFCLRAAVIEFWHGRFGEKLSIWLLAFSSAVIIGSADGLGRFSGYVKCQTDCSKGKPVRRSDRRNCIWCWHDSDPWLCQPIVGSICERQYACLAQD